MCTFCLNQFVLYFREKRWKCVSDGGNRDKIGFQFEVVQFAMKLFLLLCNYIFKDFMYWECHVFIVLKNISMLPWSVSLWT